MAADDDVHAAQRVPHRLQQVRVEPLSSDRGPQHAGPQGGRLPIYPTDPSISQIEATGFFGIGDNLFATFHGAALENQRPRELGEGTSSNPVRRRNGLPGREGKIPQRVPPCGTPNTFAGSTTAGTGHALSDFALGIINTFDQGADECKDYKVFYASSFFQDDLKVSDSLTLNLGVRFEHSPPWHEVEGRHHAPGAWRTTTPTCARRYSPPRRAARRSAATRASSVKKASSRHQIRSARASALHGTSPAMARRVFAVAAARSSISAVTANRATARSTQRRSACAAAAARGRVATHPGLGLGDLELDGGRQLQVRRAPSMNSTSTVSLGLVNCSAVWTEDCGTAICS